MNYVPGEGDRQVLFIRHAESLLQAEGSNREMGRQAVDCALSAFGRQQSFQLGEVISEIFDIDDSVIYTSPAIRAVETAEIAFAGAKIEVDERLAELSRGDHEGFPKEDVRTPEYYIDESIYLFDHSPPNGESYNQGAARLDSFLEVAEPGKIVVAVSHSRIIRAAVAAARGMTYLDAKNRRIIDITHTSLTCFSLGQTGPFWKVPFYGVAPENLESHLQIEDSLASKA